MRRQIDLSGRSFGSLIALFKDSPRTWICGCVCGAKTVARTGHLIAGSKTSCGCKAHPFKDRTGKRYGRLVVLERVSSVPIRWRCVCDCGRETVVIGTNLGTSFGRTQSCGCKGIEVHAENMRKAAYARRRDPEERRLRRNKSTNKWLSKNRTALGDTYMGRIFGMRLSDIPAPLLQARRAHLKLKRLIKEKRT